GFRKQLYVVLCLMLLGAVAELVTLGAILPFLALLASPGETLRYPVLSNALSAMGWSDPTEILISATVLFAVVALGAGAVRLLLTWVSQQFVFRVGRDLSVEVYRRTLCHPYGYHVSKNTSELIAAVNK